MDWQRKIDEIGISGKQALFCAEYVKDRNAKQAAIRAGYSERTAESQGSRLLRNAKVAQFVNYVLSEAVDDSVMAAREVLERYTRLARADANELIQSRRICCRHCWGRNNQYQWTVGELQKAQAEYQEALARWEETNKGRKPAEPDIAGGVGYDKRRDVNPDCPECFGEGVMDVFMMDSRNLSEEGKLLYAGVKVTKDGYEIKSEARDKALRALAEHHNLFQDHQKAGSGEIHIHISDQDAKL